MSGKFFGIDIQAEVSNVFTPTQTTAMTLRRFIPGTRTPGREAGGNNPTYGDFPCHGTLTDIDLEEIDDARDVIKGDKMAVIIGKDLEDAGIKPRPEDMLLIGTETYEVVTADADGFQAAWFVHCRG